MKIILNKDTFPSSTPTKAVHLQGSNCEARDGPGPNQVQISSGYNECNTSQQVGPTDTIGGSRIVTTTMDRLYGITWLFFSIAIAAKRTSTCTRKGRKQKRKRKMKKTHRARKKKKLEMKKEKKKEAKNDKNDDEDDDDDDYKTMTMIMVSMMLVIRMMMMVMMMMMMMMITLTDFVIFFKRMGDYIVYSNTIIAKDPKTDEEVCIEFECWMESVVNVDLCVPCPPPCPRHVSSGKFIVHIRFYQNDEFLAPVPDDYRMRVRRGDRVYVRVEFAGIHNLSLILDSCWVSSTDHADGDPDAIFLIKERFV